MDSLFTRGGGDWTACDRDYNAVYAPTCQRRKPSMKLNPVGAGPVSACLRPKVTTVLEPQLIELLRCPLTQRHLIEADPQLLTKLNELMERGRLTNRLGQPLAGGLDGALIDSQREYAVAVFDGIPSLVADNLIPLAQLGDFHSKTTDAAETSDAARTAKPD